MVEKIDLEWSQFFVICMNTKVLIEHDWDISEPQVDIGGTNYVCNVDQGRDQICLQSQSRWGPYIRYIIYLQFWVKRGPNMPAIYLLGTIYACNLDFLNRFLTQDDHFQGVLIIFDIAGIYGPSPDKSDPIATADIAPRNPRVTRPADSGSYRRGVESYNMTHTGCTDTLKF